jgi:membrane fusion protein, copper/silver efflux system
MAIRQRSPVKIRALFFAAILAAGGVGGGILLDRHVLRAGPHVMTAAPAPSAGDRKVLYWWDPMMPGFKSDKPGKSPMGMDMVPVHEGEEPAGTSGAVTVSPGVAQNLGVRTATVERTTLTPSIRTFGTISFDESRLSHVHVRAKGWVERLHVRVEGDPVSQGQLLFDFFSPELVSAASELVRELNRGGGQGAGADTTDISRRKLIALGVSERQIDEIRRTRQIPERIQIYAPRSGAVVRLGLADGMYVEPEMTLMSIIDHASMWIMAEVVESQGALVRSGMPVEARVTAFPGRVWKGTVDYVYPHLQAETRTVRVRVRVANEDHALRPNMFASVTIATAAREPALAIPREALIRTGAGDRVVLALGDGRFKPVPVTAGMTVGEKVEILEGLAEGDRIVASAHFLLDSETSLTAGLARLDASPAADTATNGQAPIWTEATVNAAPSADGMVSLAHAPIPAIGWPAMTMDFAFDSGVPASELAPGKRVRAGLAKNPDGTYRIVAVEPPKAAP